MNLARDYRRLRGPVLRSVSRSFYLSLRFLPQALRDPLSLAYLLARATDTIADTPEPAAEVRAEALRNLASAIQGVTPREQAEGLRDFFAPRQSNQAERALIEALPSALEWLEALDETDRREVRNVIEKITRGQTLDLERFGSGEIRALANAAELDEYTYLVAGCVGEFWTRLCFAHVSKFSDRPELEMRELGAQYGKGLQLINILRDAGSDLRQGRCYFPADELHLASLAPNEILKEPERVEPILRPWREKAEQGLRAGINYACAIRSRRIRFATALPALIGARTLTLLRQAGPNALDRKVKIPRTEVRRMILSGAVASSRSLRSKFEQL
jgi:farnesyl-diphosphate farnesyltransferase